MRHIEPVHEETLIENTKIIITTLSNGKRVYIDGKSITGDEAQEIIIILTKTWGTDFEKQDLKDLALDC